MADPAATSCSSPDHANLIATVGEQSKLIIQLFAKIQALEQKLETAQEAARGPVAPHNPAIQPPDFATPGNNYGGQQDYPAPAPSAYENKKAQAQSQPCNYGSNCTREECWYEHPSSTSSKPSASTPSQGQSTGNSTRRSKQECRYGTQCTRKKCWYEHPSGWVPPNTTTQESQPQQEFSSDAPATEVGNWSTNGDSSGWGTTPANDWSAPVDNTWGAPAPGDEWGNSTETSWSAHPGDRHKSPVNNSGSASIGMSREGSVSNSSTNKSQGRGRKARGKGRRTDSDSIATESTPMSPSPLAATPMSAPIEPIPSQTLLPPTEPIGQTPSYNEPDTLDEMNTPPLEPSDPSHSSEPEAPATPKALWSDEPTIDVVYYPNLDESQPSVPEDKDVDLPDAEPVDESLSLDQSAPSDLYSSWGVAGTSASDWGLDPTEFPDPTPMPENKTSGKNSKSKGKQKESAQTSTTGRSTPLNFAAQSETSTPSLNETNKPEPEPEPATKPVPLDPPQGVPQDQIPDWLLGADEDAHAALGIPRSVSPGPSAPSAPSRLASTNPPPRPPLSQLAGENFPTLSGILPTPKSSQPKDTPPRPTFSPRPTAWKITRTSDTSSTSSKASKGGRSKNDPNK